MSIEILWDPRWEASLDALGFEPGRHRIVEGGEWIRSARRAANRDDLFIYRHMEEGTWVLAAWLFPPLSVEGEGGVAQELKVLPGPPDRCWSQLPSLDWVRERCRPAIEIYKLAQRVRKAWYAKKRREAQEATQHRAEVAKHLKGRGKEQAAAGVGAGVMAVPRKGQGDYDDAVEDLRRRAVGRTQVVVPGR